MEEEELDSVKKKLVDLLGAKNVSDDPKVLAEYAKDKSFTPELTPAFVLKPKTAEQVEALVKLANEEDLPLIPVSSKGPHYKGDTVPTAPGAAIVDLSGMKKVIMINRTHRIAIVEPGVTWGEFIDAIAKEKLFVNMPVAPRAGKSVLASVLETEPAVNALHKWCYLDPLRCLEVTWGDGRRMWTGEAGASVMNLEQQWKEDKWQWEAVGPFMLDYYRMMTGAQGTMGIATWASIRCELAPQAQKHFIVPAKSLDALVPFAYKVLRNRLSDTFFIMNKAQLAYLMGKDADDVKALKEKLPPWAAIVGVCGRDFLPEMRVDQQESDIDVIAQSYGLQLLNSVPGIKGKEVQEKILKPCEEGKYWKETYKGAFQDIFFENTLDNAGTFVDKMYELAEAASYDLADVGVYLQPQNMGTSYHISFTLPYNADCCKETKIVKALFEKASIEFAKIGAYYLRPYGIWSRIQLNKDATSYEALLKLRKIFDPKGIMNPGKLIRN